MADRLERIYYPFYIKKMLHFLWLRVMMELYMK